MRAHRALLVSLLATSLLAACATSRDTIVLLPKEDGSTGAIAASRGGEQVLLASAYASAKSSGGKLRAGSADQQTIQKQFGSALAAMPPAPKSFTVYFLSGSDDFTEESKSTINAMLEEMRQRPSPEVTVIGHTDRVGSDDDNDALSLQRAERVKEMLVALDVPADRINVAGRGAREPLVPTERGVDEPRNRRVEVSVR